MSRPKTIETASWISRRDALKRIGLGVVMGGVLPSCLGGAVTATRWAVPPRLTSRPGTPTISGASKGKAAFAVPGSSAVVYVPDKVESSVAAPLLLLLHGALRTVDVFVDGHKTLADETGVIVLAPYASVGTWDAINGSFSTDVAVLDAALSWIFSRWTIDASRIALSGFSDGGTYSIAIGRANGDLFHRVVAYSPGFLIDVDPVGKPPFLITHGTKDSVLPIDQTSRVIVPWLRTQGYTVDYREFDGDHGVPLSAMTDVMRALGTST